jgi:hypothetical protein
MCQKVSERKRLKANRKAHSASLGAGGLAGPAARPLYFAQSRKASLRGVVKESLGLLLVLRPVLRLRGGEEGFAMTFQKGAVSSRKGLSGPPLRRCPGGTRSPSPKKLLGECRSISCCFHAKGFARWRRVSVLSRCCRGLRPSSSSSDRSQSPKRKAKAKAKGEPKGKAKPAAPAVVLRVVQPCAIGADRGG